MRKAAAGKFGDVGRGRPALLNGVPPTVAIRSSWVGGSKLRLTAANSVWFSAGSDRQASELGLDLDDIAPRLARILLAGHRRRQE